MTQFARPTSDTLVSSWTDSSGGATTIFNTLNEVVQDDADFIQSQLLPTSGLWYVTRLTSIGDPLTSANHVVSYAYERSTEAGGGTMDLEVELRQDYVSTVSPGTSIASWTHVTISSAWTSAVQTLSAAQADAITAYSSLFLVFKPKQV